MPVEQPRYTILNRLRPLLTNYWGARILTQLRYLEELNAAQGGLDDLLDELWAHTASYYDVEGAVTKEAALAIEAAMAPASPLCKATAVSCVGHAHIDMNWMWRFDETAMVAVDTLRTMLQLMREYPGFTFAQSQASVYKIIEDYAPEMLPEIRQRIEEGRWEVTASSWVETDKNMPNGESLTRHLLYTRQYLKELLGLGDGDFEISFDPDTFGHGANVPEILASGGVKYMYHCRGYDGHNLYRWRAPSGAAVTVFREHTWYNETIGNDSFLYVPEFCARHGLTKLVHVYGVGDHGGGATRRDIERIMDYDSWPCMPRLGFGRFIDFFRYLETLDLPVVDHELNFVFDGCYTSQSRIKKANRAAEAALYDAELFEAAAQLHGGRPGDATAYAPLWQNVLFNHFHDILPGSGTIDTREYAMGLFQRTMAGAGTRLSAAARAIAARIDTVRLLPLDEADVLKDSAAEGAGAGAWLDARENTFNYTAASSQGGAKRLFALFNPGQTALENAAEVTVWDWDGDMRKVKVTDETGEVLAYDLVDDQPRDFWGHKYFRLRLDCPLPPFGYRTVLLEEAPAFTPTGKNNDPKTDDPARYVLENDYVKAVFDPCQAALVSFTDKASGREYIDGARGAMFRFIEEDVTSGMTSWRVGRHASDAPAAHNPRFTGVRGDVVQSLSFECAPRGSKLRTTVSLGRRARHLQFAVSCDWREFGSRETFIPQLAFRAPLGFACDAFTCDNAFGVIQRGPRDGDVPGQSFAFAPCGAGGLMLSSDSKYGFRCADNAMALTLIRGSYDPDPTPEIYTHTFNINLGIVPDAAPQRLVEAARGQLRTAISVTCAPQNGALPLTGSLLRITEGQTVVSSVKLAEDSSDALVIRLYDVTGQGGDVALRLSRDVKAAIYVDAHESVIDGDAPAVDGCEVRVKQKAYGVTCVRCEV